MMASVESNGQIVKRLHMQLIVYYQKLFYLYCINTVLLMSISHCLLSLLRALEGPCNFSFLIFCTFSLFHFATFSLLTALESWSMQLFSFLQIFNIAHFQGRQVYQIFVSTNIVSFFTLIQFLFCEFLAKESTAPAVSSCASQSKRVY